MLSEHELDGYFDKHELSQSARDYIVGVRTSEPSRRGGDNAAVNVTVKFSSEKMGCQIAAESHTAELSFIKLAEFRPDVYEYYDQPSPVEIYKLDKNQRPHRATYTADFLTLSDNGPCVNEVKHWKEIERLLEKDPRNWVLQDGQICYLPAKHAFERLGIAHNVHVYQKEDNFLLANISLILEAPRSLTSAESKDAEKVLSYLHDHAWSTIKQIGDDLNIPSYSVIFSLLRNHQVFAALNLQLLANAEVAIVSTSKDVLEKAIDSISDEVIASRAQCGLSVPLTGAPTLKAAETALRNLDYYHSDVRDRKWRRLKRKVVEGSRHGLTPFQCLIPRFHASGNRAPRLVHDVSEFLINFIRNEYADSRNLSKSRAYENYKVASERAHPMYRPVSRKTFIRYLKNCDRQEISRKRGGRRLANQSADPSDVFDRAIKQEIPFLAASIDHYNVDLHTVVAIVGDTVFTARCWLTGIVDLGTGNLLGRYFSLHKPSRISCAMALRGCIRRHGKLPSLIMSDRGKEFESVYYDSVIAHFGSCSALRPAEFSRYGSEIEMLFGLFKKRALIVLPGNIQSLTNSRSHSKTHSSQSSAQLWPRHLIEHFDVFIENEHNRLVGTNIDSSSQKMFKTRQEFNFIGRDIQMTQEVKVITAVDAKRYKLDRSRGLHNEYDLHFWHPDLATLAHGQKVDVRDEPEDPYCIYARVGNKWVPCFASKEQQFQARSRYDQEEIALLVQKPNDLRARIRAHSSESLVRAQQALLEEQLLEIAEESATGSLMGAQREFDIRDAIACASQNIIPIEVELRTSEGHG